MEEQNTPIREFDEQINGFNDQYTRLLSEILSEGVTSENYKKHSNEITSLSLKADEIVKLSASAKDSERDNENRKLSNETRDHHDIDRKVNQVKTSIFGVKFTFQSLIKRSDDLGVKFMHLKAELSQIIQDCDNKYQQILLSMQAERMSVEKVVALCQDFLLDANDLSEGLRKISELPLAENLSDFEVKPICRIKEKFQKVEKYLEYSQILQKEMSMLYATYKKWQDSFSQYKNNLSNLEEEYRDRKQCLLYDNGMIPLLEERFEKAKQETLKYHELVMSSTKLVVLYQEYFPHIKKNLEIDWNLLKVFTQEVEKVSRDFAKKLKAYKLEKERIEKNLCSSDNKKPNKPSKNQQKMKQREKKQGEQKPSKSLDPKEIQVFLKDHGPMAVVAPGRIDGFGEYAAKISQELSIEKTPHSKKGHKQPSPERFVKLPSSSSATLQFLKKAKKEKPASEKTTLTPVIDKEEQSPDNLAGNAGVVPQSLAMVKPGPLIVYQTLIFWEPRIVLNPVAVVDDESQIPEEIKEQAVWITPPSN